MNVISGNKWKQEGLDLFGVLFRNLPRGTERNRERLSHDNSLPEFEPCTTRKRARRVKAVPVGKPGKEKGMR
jgi:hypothetical protein